MIACPCYLNNFVKNNLKHSEIHLKSPLLILSIIQIIINNDQIFTLFVKKNIHFRINKMKAKNRKIYSLIKSAKSSYRLSLKSARCLMAELFETFE